MTCAVKPLTREQQALCLQWEGYALMLAHRHLARARHLRRQDEDALQEARLAVARAAQTWKPEQGKFCTYLLWWVRCFVGKYDRRGSRVVPLPAGEWVPPQEWSLDQRSSGVDDEEADSTRLDLFTWTPADDGLDARDGERLMAQAAEKLLRRHLARFGARPTPGQRRRSRRDVAFFLRHRFEGVTLDVLAEEAGLATREGARQIVLRVQPAFDAWAAEVRAEAEG
ncbi:sigma factor [Myxococcus sp. Y35]|uniref:sigma factor n=1 Tax=Pseudomyxococcus flavus TaxID=3115648 RepID=UPI003CF551B5